MTKINNPSDIRKTLLLRGYTPLPNRDKRCLYKGWPEVVVTEDLIGGNWSRMHRDKATGLRLGTMPSGLILGAADCDVSLPAVLDAILDLWCDYLPDIFDDPKVPLLERGTTASCKVAFFIRLTETFGRLATHDFEADDGSIHKVEIFGGASARQFGAFGAHSIEKGSEYVWRADSPLDVDLASLPSLNKGQCARLVEIAEEVMRSKGMRQVERSHDDDDKEIVYDITEEMEFENGDSVYSLAELKAVLRTIDSMRITASWHDPTGINPTRCIARLLEDGALLITDFGEDGLKHMEASKATKIDQEAIDAAFALLGEMIKEPPQEGEGAAAVAARLRAQWVYCPDTKAQVISIQHPDWQIPQSNFITMMLPFSETRLGPRGGEVQINPAKLWLADRERLTVKGLQMRPAMTQPLFEEHGHLWLNTYRPPAHDVPGGSSKILWEFIEQLAPIETERAWFKQNLAFKFLHPEIPGPAVIMLAQDQFGTGRGTFMVLLEKLFGRYVSQLPAHLFTGTSYQAQYTEWLADNVIVCIEEMVELRGGTKYAAKHDLYERLKELIEPRLKRRKIVRRGTKATDEWVSCSLYAFLNNLDDIPVHERDRRCFGLTNGGPREASFWMAVNASLERPEDVAAFAADLRSIDLTGYSPYDAPPMTEAKLDMAEAAKSDVERGMEAALAAIEGKSEVFSLLHIVNGMRFYMTTDRLHYPEMWESLIGRIVGKRFRRVGIRNGINWQPMFDGRRWPTYAWTPALAAKWTPVDAGFVERELMKAGPVKSSGDSFKGWNSPFGKPDDQD